MNFDPTSIQSRALAAALLLLILGAAWQFAVSPTVDAFSTQRDFAERSRLLLEGYGRRTVSPDELEAQLADLQSQQSGEHGFVAGSNTAMGSAALQATTKRMWEANGGVLRSLQVLSTRSDASARRVGVRVDGSIPYARILDLLAEFRAAEPYLFVDNLQIRVPETPATRTSRQYPDLTIRAEIYGYMRLGEP